MYYHKNVVYAIDIEPCLTVISILLGARKTTKKGRENGKIRGNYNFDEHDFIRHVL